MGHATYEERMMELLPATETCQNHIQAHKAAHAGIARRLKQLGNEVANALPAVAAHSLRGLVGNWLGDHAARFDDRLVKLGHQGDSAEIDFDAELVAMLDLHVFPNRPTIDGRLQPPQYAQKLEMRGRFESLTAAQRKVYWLVIAGRKNPEIAAELVISINTVKSHRSAIFQKFEVSSVLELVKKTDALR
jgi:DNA-binding CsgD family transcriptional regulator